MQLTLVRHGETYWNELGKVQGQIDIELLPSGIEQAARLGEKMASNLCQFRVIYSSQLQRARITAEKIRGLHSLEIKVDERLNSRNLGDFSGLTLQQINKKWPDLYRLWISGDETFCPPNGESTLKMVERTRDFIRMLLNTYSPSDKIMIVTHRENLGAFLHLITKKKSKDPLGSIQNCTPYEISLDDNALR
jgi:broad specificity phosphatase PhoE